MASSSSSLHGVPILSWSAKAVPLGRIMAQFTTLRHQGAPKINQQLSFTQVEFKLAGGRKRHARQSHHHRFKDGYGTTSEDFPQGPASRGTGDCLGRRSEERRVGKECVSPCRSRWSPYH